MEAFTAPSAGAKKSNRVEKTDFTNVFHRALMNWLVIVFVQLSSVHNILLTFRSGEGFSFEYH